MKASVIVKAIGFIALLFLLYILIFGVITPLGCSHSVEEDRLEVPSAETLSQGGEERILCIDDNSEALLWRIRVMESAQEEIILSSFDMRNDNSARDIMACLMNAADRGVQVKFLLDGVSGFLLSAGCDTFRALAAQPNVEIKLYNPIDLLRPWTLNYRLHDKYLIADDQVYILGGRNIHDLFLGDYGEKQNMDRDILTYEAAPCPDSSLNQVRDYFQRIWALPECELLRYDGSHYSAEAEELRSHYQVLRESCPEAFLPVRWQEETFAVNSICLLTNPIEPENKAPTLWYALNRLMGQGEDILIQSPYVICSQGMYDDLEALCGAGKQLSVMINAVESGANPWGCADYMNQKKAILNTGVEIYEYRGSSSSHTKTVLIDDQISVVGSFNVDMRSTYLDTEMMLVIDSPELNAMLREEINACMDESRHILPDGSQIPGPNCPEEKMGPMRNALMWLFRAVTVPIRHLL